MFIFQFLAVAALFFLLTPGVLVNLRGSRYYVAAVHAILFTFIISVIYMLFWLTPLIEEGPVSIDESNYGNCPTGQNWISGTIKRYGYCSPSTVSAILTQPNVSSPVPGPSPAVSPSSCPAGQNWISGTNKKYGYCSPEAVSTVLSDKLSSQAGVSTVVTASQADTVAEKPAASELCPPGQNRISGTNPNYGYCSPSTVSNLLSDPSRSSIFEIDPVDVRGASTFQ